MSHHRPRSAHINAAAEADQSMLEKVEINNIPVVNELLQQQINVGEQWKSYEI